MPRTTNPRTMNEAATATTAVSAIGVFLDALSECQEVLQCLRIALALPPKVDESRGGPRLLLPQRALDGGTGGEDQPGMQGVEVPAEGPPLHGTRIVGGFEAEPYERGYQAFLSGGGGVCGAAVISELFVLTAAHCIPKKSDARMTVTVGIHDRRVKEDFTQTIPVAKTFVHPRYKPKEGHLKGDIALLKLEEKVHMNDKVFPIKLPTRNVDEYMEVVVTGWGRTLSEVTKPLTTLQEIVTRTIPLKECENYFRWVDKSIFCTTAANWDVGPCNGDSGGPAMHEGYLVGLVSFSTKGSSMNEIFGGGLS
ncbi:Granzyme B [Penaeus vannamei]|uniref:Granzyme B n=1 Tax=Penaeus vannamei TaxID=6689 RepID=A0A3R7MJX2_PENVA|nr:Granzyme B [Penaeus vannamei]